VVGFSPGGTVSVIVSENTNNGLEATEAGIVRVHSCGTIAINVGFHSAEYIHLMKVINELVRG
jgi:hypothetical protein